MSRFKYYATLDFGGGNNPIKFTAVDLEHLMKRFNKEVENKQKEVIERREYYYVTPNLTVEVK